MAALSNVKLVVRNIANEKFRPCAPEELVKKIITYLEEKISPPFDTAVDVGCGSGKSTEILSPYFTNVIGFDSRDINSNYLFKNEGLHNIIYRNGTPEGIGCLDSTVQLVTASQSAHWFNLLKFYSETERILSPGGVLAIYGYSLPVLKEPEVNKVIQKLMLETLKDYMPQQSKTLYVHNYNTKEFKDFVFNKEPLVRDENTSVEVKGTVFDLVDYIRNTSTLQNFLRIRGEKETNNLLYQFQKQLMSGTNQNPKQEPLDIIFNFVAILGRKPF